MGKYVDGLVSVIMPTYKRSEKLTRAIKSVLNQSYTNIELLLINDNEPDDEFTKELLKRINGFENDSRFRLIIQEKHINGAVARNVGIKQAQGEYIAFLDDDDWWEKDKLEHQVKYLKKLDKTYGGVSCKYMLRNQEGKVIGKSIKYKGGNIYKDILMLETDVTTCSLLLRRECLDKTGYFDENLLRHQDFQLLTFFTYYYKLDELDEFLLNIDVSDGQNRPNGDKLIEHKQRFFLSIKPILDKMSPSEVKSIKAVHMFEIGYVYFKSRDYKNGIKYCGEMFTSFSAFSHVSSRITKKVVSMIRRNANA